MTTERPQDEPFGMPSAEALKMATDFIRRRYVLPETMQHPQVRSECMRLAYFIQAYGLAVRGLCSDQKNLAHHLDVEYVA